MYTIRFAGEERDRGNYQFPAYLSEINSFNQGSITGTIFDRHDVKLCLIEDDSIVCKCIPLRKGISFYKSKSEYNEIVKKRDHSIK